MKLVWRQSGKYSHVLFNEENGDYMDEVTAEQMKKYGSGLTGRPEIWKYRLYRKNDRQLFSIRLKGVYPVSEADRLKWAKNPPLTQEEEFQNGLEIEMLSNWGSYFPESEIDDFVPYIFEFFYRFYSGRAPHVKFTYIYPINGKKFEFERSASCGEKP